MMLSSHPQENGARQTSGDLSEKLVSTPRFPQQNWRMAVSSWTVRLFSNLSHQHLKISYHHMASLRRNLKEKYDEVYAPSNGISPGNSGEKFDEEPYRSFSLSEISVHESACIFQRSPTKLSTQQVIVLSRLSPKIRMCLLLGLV